MKFIFTICIISTLALSGHALQYWTRWLNRDRPSGTGDWETYSSFKPVPCHPGFKPVSAECRLTKSNLIWYWANEVIPSGCYQCTPRGFVCQNKHQPDRFCNDYKIRFLCYKPRKFKG